MTDAMDRLRNANPARAHSHVPDGLFDAIVATPGDERLRPIEPRSRRRQRRFQIAIALAALVVGVSAAWAAVSGALELFQTNPQGQDAAPGTLWDQDVIASSVVRAAVLSIPNYGDVEFWYADAEQGGWCGAIRLPNGTWAATKESGIGGTAPGCYPTREQTNAVDPVFVINGFDYYENQVDARSSGGMFWRIYYGILSTDRPVASVVDRITGRRAEVHAGKRFAIAVPDLQPETEAPSPGYALDLVAYDAAGNVVAEEHPDGR
jgi:hypothetical protein